MASVAVLGEDRTNLTVETDSSNSVGIPLQSLGRRRLRAASLRKVGCRLLGRSITPVRTQQHFSRRSFPEEQRCRADKETRHDPDKGGGHTDSIALEEGTTTQGAHRRSHNYRGPTPTILVSARLLLACGQPLAFEQPTAMGWQSRGRGLGQKAASRA
jgi:hypothetical protein